MSVSTGSPPRERQRATSETSSIKRAFMVFETITRAGSSGMSLTDIVREVSLPKSTVHRLLGLLCEERYVARVGNRYVAGTLLAELEASSRYTRYSSLRDAALDPLCHVLDRGGMAVNIAVLAGTEIQWIEKINGTNGARIGSRVGARFPATCSALGKALLAHADPKVVHTALRTAPRVTPYSVVSPALFIQQITTVAEVGYAWEREESALGISCVAVPVFQGDKVVAAISVTSNNELDPAQFGRILNRSARAIERNLGPG